MRHIVSAVAHTTALQPGRDVVLVLELRLELADAAVLRVDDGLARLALRAKLLVPARARPRGPRSRP